MAQTVGDYELLQELGRGGMGAVYLARHRGLGRQVALKVLHPELADPHHAARFAQEAQALGQLRHPNIVAVHEARLDGPRPYLALELVQGESASQLLNRRGALPPREAVELILAIAAGLAHAHGVGILHRDLKPGNILAGGDGVPRLTDFGLARGLAETHERLTRTGELMGTPGYMAPEQVDDAKGVDARADVYGLAATLYALLTCQAPFTGASATNIIVKVLQEPPAPPSAHAESVPKELDWIVLKALRKAPDERYPTVEAFAADLRRWLSGGEVEATAPPRRLPGGLLAAGLLLMCAGLLAAALWGSDPRPVSVDRPGADPVPLTSAETVQPVEELARRRLAKPFEFRASWLKQGGRLRSWGEAGVLVIQPKGSRLGVFAVFRPGDAGFERVGREWTLDDGHNLSTVVAVGERVFVATNPSGDGPSQLFLATPGDKDLVAVHLDGLRGRAENAVSAARAPVLAFVAQDQVVVCRLEGQGLVQTHAIREDVYEDLLALSPDGRRLVKVPKRESKRQRVTCWELAPERKAERLWETRHQDVASFAFDGEGERVAVGGGMTLSVSREDDAFDTPADESLGIGVIAHLTDIQGVAFGSSGALFSASNTEASSEQRGRLKEWRHGGERWVLHRAIDLPFRLTEMEQTRDAGWLLFSTRLEEDKARGVRPASAWPLPLSD